MISSQWYNHTFDLAIKLSSSLVPGIQVNRNAIDRSMTNASEKQDLNIWVADRLLVAGEAKRFSSQFTEGFKEIADKTCGKYNVELLLALLF